MQIVIHQAAQAFGVIVREHSQLLALVSNPLVVSLIRRGG